MKKVCILKGSPRAGGNTNALLKPFAEELKEKGCECREFDLYRMDLKPCVACRCCQKDWTVFGCPLKDDMQKIFDAIRESELLILATPIYSWFCTGPMKNVLDRMVYGMNKYYGEEKGPSLWEGKELALVISCGYRPERGADLFEEARKRYCKHSRLFYRGMLAERHLGYQTEFMDQEKEWHAREFACGLLETGCKQDCRE